MSLMIFLHGLHSGNQGTKSVFFRERYPDILIPNFVGELPERMEKLNNILSEYSGIRIVGSSFGGLMAYIFAMENEARVERLVLLAPAINLIGLSDYEAKKISTPVRIYHGINDDVIPLEDVRNMAEKQFPNLTFHEVNDDHFLHNTFNTIDWDNLLKI